RTYPSIIVAGTNGKGSTSATIASVLQESGYRTGFYTSPHLVDIRERWKIGGSMIEHELLQRSVEMLRDAADRVAITPTYFEALTIVAFIAFDLAGCEVAVLEVGMGGRLDATNVIRPIASVITPIGMDHMEYLGSTLRKIAAEKAGIIHRGSIVLTSNDDPKILEVLRRRAAQFDNRFIHVMEEHDSVLAGEFQRRNTGLAVRTARELQTILPQITDESIERGVAKTRWRGRLEKFEIGETNIWVDGCHNPHAVQAVIPFIMDSLARPRLLVFGIMSDKAVMPVVEELFPLFDHVIVTEPYPPRSMRTDVLLDAARTLGVSATAEKQPDDAMRSALASDYRSIFVGGSLYLAGAAVGFLDAQHEERGQ